MVFCTRPVHTEYVRKWNEFSAYVVMLCHVMWCFVPPWIYLDLHLFLPPPLTLQADVFCPRESSQLYPGTEYTQNIIFMEWKVARGIWHCGSGAMVDGWEISREMVSLARSSGMVSKNICRTRCVDVVRWCRFRAERSPTFQGAPKRLIVLHFLCQTYLNIIINLIWNKFRLYLIMIPSFK